MLRMLLPSKPALEQPVLVASGDVRTTLLSTDDRYPFLDLVIVFECSGNFLRTSAFPGFKSIPAQAATTDAFPVEMTEPVPLSVLERGRIESLCTEDLIPANSGRNEFFTSTICGFRHREFVGKQGRRTNLYASSEYVREKDGTPISRQCGRFDRYRWN